MNNSAVRTRKSDATLIKEMEAYLRTLTKQPSKKAYSEAKDALHRTGVITKGGKTKKKIVSWE